MTRVSLKHPVVAPLIVAMVCGLVTVAYTNPTGFHNLVPYLLKFAGFVAFMTMSFGYGMEYGVNRAKRDEDVLLHGLKLLLWVLLGFMAVSIFVFVLDSVPAIMSGK